MEWLPTLSVDVEKVATPLPFRVPEPIADAPSLKATLPDGVPAELVTVAVKVTGLPKADGLAEEVRAVGVAVLPALPPLPPLPEPAIPTTRTNPTSQIP